MRWLEWQDRAGSWTVVFETHLQPLLPCRALGAQLVTTRAMFQLGWKSS